MTNTVIVYYHGTFVNRQNGAQARVAELLRHLQESGKRTIVYSYYDHRACPWTPAEVDRFASDFPGIELVLDHRPAWFNRITFLKLRLIALLPHMSTRLLELHFRGVTPQYDALWQRHPEATLIVNYAEGLIELNGLAAKTPIIETHDLKFANAAKSLGRRLTSLKTMLSARAELELLDHASMLIAIAPPEAAIFQLLYAPKPIVMISAYALSPRALRAKEFRYDLLFVGSENILNVEGLVGFITTHRAWLHTHSLAVVGRVCFDERVQAAVQDLPGVDLCGYVDDLENFTAACKLLIAPVDGTGLKIKVLEALAIGRPVFASTSALAGLPAGYDACAFPIDENAMQAMLDDDNRRVDAEEAAVVYCRDHMISKDIAILHAHLDEDRKKPSI